MQFIKVIGRRMSTKFTSLDQLPFTFNYLKKLPIELRTSKFKNLNSIQNEMNKSQFLEKLNEDGEQIEGSKVGLYTLVLPEPQPNPKILHTSNQMLQELGLDIDTLDRKSLTEYLSGNKILPGTYPWAHSYVGHQFGIFAGWLGDGRAMSLAEIEREVDAKKVRYEIQLKGSGETPYSRMGDGFAVLRSSIREYLASEVMAALDVPTTRVLSIVSTARLVHREELEKGSVVARISPSFIRFGSFQAFQYMNDSKNLKVLADYTIDTFFPQFKHETDKYKLFYKEVATLTAEMVAKWQAIGFCHGVLNTDNMSILGLTLDYGPYGFISKFEPKWTPNLSDTTARYCYKDQPEICGWNLRKLGEALQPLLDPELPPFPIMMYGDDEVEFYKENPHSPYIDEVIQNYSQVFNMKYRQLMAKKLGLDAWTDENDSIFKRLFELLENTKIDYHHFFRLLSNAADSLVQHIQSERSNEAMTTLITDLLPKGDDQSIEKLQSWLTDYSKLLSSANISPTQRMLKINPRFVLKNWILNEVIDRSTKLDNSMLDAVYILLTKFPYAEDQEIDFEKYSNITPELTKLMQGDIIGDVLKDIKCSCSS